MVEDPIMCKEWVVGGGRGRWVVRAEWAAGGVWSKVGFAWAEGWKGGSGWGLMGLLWAGMGVEPSSGVGGSKSNLFLDLDFDVKSSGVLELLGGFGVESMGDKAEVAAGDKEEEWLFLESDNRGKFGIAENNRVDDKMDEAREEEEVGGGDTKDDEADVFDKSFKTPLSFDDDPASSSLSMW
jgi:hypothetical protein